MSGRDEMRDVDVGIKEFADARLLMTKIWIATAVKKTWMDGMRRR